MLIHPGHHLGDSWYATDGDGVVHAFYLVCPEDVPRHTAWDIARATSRDLVTWELHGVALERGDDGDWDGGCLATGSVLAVEGGYLLAYTARWNEPSVATGLAWSPDLVRWTKHAANPVSRPVTPYVTDRPVPGRPATHWRDPYLRRGADGRLQQLITASRGDVDADASGTIAVLTDDRHGTWTVGPPLALDAVTREVECPQVVEVDGGWFLVFSTWPQLFAGSVRAEHGARLRPGTYAMAGDGPDGPFRFTQPEPIVPASTPAQPYAGQLVAHGGGHVLLGTVWRADGPDCICDPIPVRRHGDRLVAG